jgi:alkaline phosphatase D
MIGAVEQDSARIWMRLSGAFEASIRIGSREDLADARQVAPVRASQQRDRCVEILVDGLEPGQSYWWIPLVDGEPDKYLAGLPPFRLRTAPAGPARFRVAFGSCARIQADGEQSIWPRVREHRPDLFFWLGDNVYGDTLDPEVLAEEYRRQRDVPALQPLLRSVPQLATWDDHDFGLNDSGRTNPIRGEALEVFGRYWANPGRGRAEVPGVFFAWSYGGADFFFLDDRYHRDPNDAEDGPGKTMLGEGQLAWLRDGLARSEAPFKLLVSGSGWSAAKGPGGDAWSAFLAERDALFDWIAAERIEGVVLLSGDTHVAELNCIPWSDRGGYDLYDLVSSPLAQEPSTSWRDRRPELRIRPVHGAGPNFGRLDFDLVEADPRLHFTVVGVDGRAVWQPLELRASELRPGVRSWPEKIDAGELRRRERAAEAGPDSGRRIR